MPEKLDPQFFGKVETSSPMSEKETEIERKERLGKESEWTLILPLLQDLKREGVFSYAEHTTEEVDKSKPWLDFIIGLEDGSHLAVQSSLTESEETWRDKIKKIMGGDEKGRPLLKPWEELKDIHPKPELLTRKERIERVPKIPLRLDWDTVNNAYKRFETSGRRGEPFDFLPQKHEIEKELLLTQLTEANGDTGFG